MLNPESPAIPSVEAAAKAATAPPESRISDRRSPMVRSASDLKSDLNPESCSSLPVIDITPPSGWLDLNLRELWQFRELLYFFVWRDIKVRYKQTAIGAAWAVLQPLMT